jgi:hypothetical protein
MRKYGGRGGEKKDRKNHEEKEADRKGNVDDATSI